jgi:penicillin-binding protein 1A
VLPLQGLSDKTKKYLRWFWGLVLSPFIILFLLIISVSFGWLGELPDTAELENPKYFLATEIYATDGQVLGKFYAENRSPATYQDLDSNLINALIATEDARFREHSGIDFRGLVRVFGRTIIGGDQSGGGGSTISQQLAKMLFPREKISSKRMGNCHPP